MSSFTEPLVVEPIAGVRMWRTSRSFAYELGMKGSGLAIVVDAGTETDLGTIPWFASWFVAPADPRFAAAFVLHDRLYRTKGFSRWLADAALFEALVVLGMTTWRAAIVWLAVRAIGGFVRRS